MSRSAAKDSFAPTGLKRQNTNNHGLQPWLPSYAAPRLLKPDQTNLDSVVDFVIDPNECLAFGII
jgi:hypothetical protein